MSTFSLPLPVAEAIRELGHRIRIARLRRGWSVIELAAKAGLSRNTLAKMERGSPSPSLGDWYAVIWLLGLDKTLLNVADPEQDSHGKALEAARRPRRAAKPRAVSDEYDF
jgi:transcriptional regulator with XRE-family HTH domain